MKKILLYSLAVVFLIGWSLAFYGQSASKTLGLLYSDVYDKADTASIPSHALSESKDLNPASGITKQKEYNCLVPDEKQLAEETRNILSRAFQEMRTTEVQLMFAASGVRMNSNGEQASEFKKENINSRLDTLARLIEDTPSDRLTNYQLVNVCGSAIDNVHCSDDKLKEAIERDSLNGALWGVVASINYRKGKLQEVLSALDQAAGSPIFDVFRNQQISRFNTTLKSLGINKQYAFVLAIGYDAAAIDHGISAIFRFCNQVDKVVRADIVRTCLNYGERLESDGGTLLATGVGVGLQKKMYKLLNDQTSLAKVEDRRIKSDKMSGASSFIQPELFYDNSFLDYWVLTMQNHSELETLRIVSEEAKRLTSNPDYSPCPAN